MILQVQQRNLVHYNAFIFRAMCGNIAEKNKR